VDRDRQFTFGNYSLRLAVGRGGSDDDQEGGLPSGHDIARVGGRHLTLALRHRSWDDLTDSERSARLHEHL
jgi:hypothetical protein